MCKSRTVALLCCLLISLNVIAFTTADWGADVGQQYQNKYQQDGDCFEVSKIQEMISSTLPISTLAKIFVLLDPTLCNDEKKDGKS